MKRLIPILTLLLVLALCGGAWGADYYVDATLGNDSNDGLAQTDEGGGVGPWKTIGRVNAQVGSITGSDLVIDGGLENVTGDDWTSWYEYTSDSTLTSEESEIHAGSESVKFVGAGSGNHPYLRSQATVAVSASTNYLLSFWTKGDGTYGARTRVYDATHGADIIAAESQTYMKAATWCQVFVPFTTPAGCIAVYIYTYGDKASGATIYCDDVSLYETSGPLQPGDLVLFEPGETFSAPWLLNSSGTNALLYPTVSGTSGSTITYGKAPGAGADPILSGEYDSGTPLYRNHVVRVDGVDYLSFSDLNFIKAKNTFLFFINQTDGVTVNGCTGSDSGRTVAPSAGEGQAIVFSEGADLSITDCTFHNLYAEGIRVAGVGTIDLITGIVISGNKIYDGYNIAIAIFGSWEGALDYSINGGTISDNYTHDNRCGIYVNESENLTIEDNVSLNDNDQTVANADSYGVALEEVSNTTVQRNSCVNAYSHGIEVWAGAAKPAYNNVVRYNYCADHTRGELGENSGTGIKFSGGMIDNNVCDNNITEGNVYGIYIQDGDDDGNVSQLLNNTITLNGWGLVVDIGTGGWNFVNNLIAHNTDQQVHGFGTDPFTHTHTYNLYYDTGSDNEIVYGSDSYTIAQALTFEATAKNTDPLMTNPASGDFTLQAGSPCINAGLIGGAVDNDNIRISGVNGTAFVDLGAGTLLTAYPDGRVVVIDSGSDELVGYIKAVGTGETYGSELFTDPSFEAVTKAAAKTVLGITKANPGVVTFAAEHGYVNGDIIYFSGLTEMTELNTEYWQLRANAGDTFELATVYDTTSLDTSGYGSAETTGGSCAQRTTFTNWSVAYPTWVVGVDGAGALTNTAANVGSGANQVIYEQITAGADLLFRLTTICDALTAGTYGGYVGSQYLAFTGVNDVDTLYWYGSNGNADRNHGIAARASLAASFTDVSLKQVLTPGTTGVTIVSTSGGSTFNWFSIGEDFSYNDAGNYTYKIYPATDYAGNPIVGELDIGAYEYQGAAMNIFRRYYQN